ncbi:pyrimidine operon attenuation protein / uracil phosphoribosyltransferase [Lishizhenia tianjinensis]|uniref:Bifunctional protein PyrR n=2 Tax=Crocinitomicaceae TaxID=1853230 RepID=A0A1I7AGQ9_9FLAO|nr:pyrimidine operon attenuation protein / uracil phosphoribosyltransferase [Lishizhenia tianjinensis]
MVKFLNKIELIFGANKLYLSPMEKQVILNSKHFELTLNRLCYQLIESHNDFSNSVLIGLQPRGVKVLDRLKAMLENITGHSIACGTLDITFYRDDFRRRERPPIPSATNIDFSIENKRIVLIDDVLYTGRTIRSGLDALLAFGRPSEVELLTLVDRRFKRHLPIQADYVGKTVDTLISERVSVEWKEIEGEDKVVLYTPNNNG